MCLLCGGLLSADLSGYVAKRVATWQLNKGDKKVKTL
jgi:hypothetical protein